MPRRSQPLRIAIDTGGTFTDCVWIDSAGRLQMLKVFSTPADPSEAIVEALRKINPMAEIILLHGTTVGTNALLERKGARTALVTTAGFEDALEIGRQARTRLYDLFFDRIEPLVPKELRFGIEERTASDGRVLMSPTATALQSMIAAIKTKRPEAIAVSLLFSFANPQNEKKVAEGLVAASLSISHQILPEFREYERTSTTVLNAYLQPVMQRYLEKLDASSRLEAAAVPAVSKPRIFVMQSSGGITPLVTAAHEPVRTVLSGPAGGVMGAAASARRSGFVRIISFDMGGTSTDVSLIDGWPATANDSQVAGLPVAVPMLDIHTVGAGGGSLARFDAGGVLRVGPDSAGADPGPICYGRGTQPTVTDANLLLDRLQAQNFLGGDFTLDIDRTRRVTREWLRRQQTSLTLDQFAAGMIRVINSTMEKAIRVVSIERGYDPREFALVAFGGAGGLHACALAESLGIPNVLVPAFPGALSAFGILESGVVKDYSRTVLWRMLDKIPHQQLAREFSILKQQAAKEVRREKWEGTVCFQRSADIRYRGQGYELNLPITEHLIADFQKEHHRRYGYSHSGRELELVTLRLRATIKSRDTVTKIMSVNKIRVGMSTASQLGVQPKRRVASRASVLFDGKNFTAGIYLRSNLQFWKTYSGPAVVCEYSATTVIPARKRFHLDRAGNLIIAI